MQHEGMQNITSGEDGGGGIRRNVNGAKKQKLRMLGRLFPFPPVEGERCYSRSQGKLLSSHRGVKTDRTAGTAAAHQVCDLQEFNRERLAEHSDGQPRSLCTGRSARRKLKA